MHHRGTIPARFVSPMTGLLFRLCLSSVPVGPMEIPNYAPDYARNSGWALLAVAWCIAMLLYLPYLLFFDYGMLHRLLSGQPRKDLFPFGESDLAHLFGFVLPLVYVACALMFSTVLTMLKRTTAAYRVSWWTCVISPIVLLIYAILITGSVAFFGYLATVIVCAYASPLLIAAFAFRRLEFARQRDSVVTQQVLVSRKL